MHTVCTSPVVTSLYDDGDGDDDDEDEEEFSW